MRAWLLSAYRSDSHGWWADWLTRCITDFDWCKRELPGRHFRWRIRGNPLSWLHQLPSSAPDLVVATSMVDLATVKGLHPRLAQVPSLYYFHENQFAYPRGEHQARSLEPQMVQLYGALVATRCVFNSQYNLDSFLDGVNTLLANMPDAVPDGIETLLQTQSLVLPVPVQPLPAGDKHGRLIVWNHRWEYDKAPEIFAEAMLRLAARGVDFKLALLGARPLQTPAALQRLRDSLPQHILVDAHADSKRYQALLAQSDIVVSTALHEFQGLAVMQAVSAGATPLLPDALCYREQYPDCYRYPAGDVGALCDRLQQWLQHRRPVPPDISAFYEEALRGDWRRLLREVANANKM